MGCLDNGVFHEDQGTAVSYHCIKGTFVHTLIIVIGDLIIIENIKNNVTDMVIKTKSKTIFQKYCCTIFHQKTVYFLFLRVWLRGRESLIALTSPMHIKCKQMHD